MKAVGCINKTEGHTDPALQMRGMTLIMDAQNEDIYRQYWNTKTP
jgi:hypothetical protein